MRIRIAGEEIELLPDRAVHWPRERTLLVADLHFGKDAHFRSRGFAVPSGTTHADLARLDRAIDATSARRVVVLGDFLHDVGSHAPETLDALVSWRRARAALEIALVAGNHDARAGLPPEELAIERLEEPHRASPFALVHHPCELDDAYVLGGHVHPGVRLAPRSGPRGRALQLPIFLVGPRRAILPSFGGFTGLGLVEPGSDERVFLCGAGSVVEWTLDLR